MKKLSCLFIAFALLLSYAYALPAPPEIPAASAVLMEKSTGRVLYQKNAHTPLAPASVTKVMTLLIVMESLESGKISMDDTVTVSPYAASMGGSQVFLEPGEKMSLDDMLKATVIASGNDSATALAEHIAGSADGFVSLMNQRAKELGMADTVFKNCTGLDEDGHVTSAHDIAIMSRELIKYDAIKKYTTVWMDTLRNGEFQLANTNKLLRTYNGITGLKTGSTGIAKYCMSATAERDGMELIAAIMAAPSTAERFSSAAALLDYGFANFALYDAAKNVSISPVPVLFGKQNTVTPKLSQSGQILVEKSDISKLQSSIALQENVHASVQSGQKLGEVKITNGTTQVASIPIVASKSIEKLTFADIFWNLLSVYLMK